MAASGDSALRHFGKVLLVFAVIATVYSLGLAGFCNVRPESMFSSLGPRATSVKACLAEGWATVPYQALFWLTAAVVFTLYNALTGEIDPER